MGSPCPEVSHLQLASLHTFFVGLSARCLMAGDCTGCWQIDEFHSPGSTTRTDRNKMTQLPDTHECRGWVQHVTPCNLWHFRTGIPQFHWVTPKATVFFSAAPESNFSVHWVMWDVHARAYVRVGPQEAMRSIWQQYESVRLSAYPQHGERKKPDINGKNELLPRE